MFLCYCLEGAAGVEFRQLQSSQGIVSAWALAAPELDVDETLSPKPSCIGPGAAQNEPSSPRFPSSHSSRPPAGHFHFPSTHFMPLELSHPLPLWPLHCNTSALYRWHGVLHSITLHSFTLYNNRLLLRYRAPSICA